MIRREQFNILLILIEVIVNVNVFSAVTYFVKRMINNIIFTICSYVVFIYIYIYIYICKIFFSYLEIQNVWISKFTSEKGSFIPKSLLLYI